MVEKRTRSALGLVENQVDDDFFFFKHIKRTNWLLKKHHQTPVCLSYWRDVALCQNLQF